MTRAPYELTLISILFLAAGILSVSLYRGAFAPAPLLAVFALGCFWLLIQAALAKTAPAVDRLLLPLTCFLTAIGLVFIFRLKPALFWPQLAWAALGVCAFGAVVLKRRRLGQLYRYKYSIGLLGIVLLLVTLLFGVDIGGNKNWLALGSFRVQPSEFSRLCIIIFISGYLSSRHIELGQSLTRIGPLQLPHFRFLAPLLAVWGLAMLMLVVQRDLGAALLYFGSALILTCLASGRWAIAALGSLFFACGSAVAYHLFPHVRTRIDIWLTPWADPDGSAYQLLQSLFALGSGGVFGSGLAAGHPELIPEVHTDFIFSAIGEELGFAGVACILMLYLLLLYRCFGIALRSRTVFAGLTGAGLSLLLCLQIFIILAGTTNLLPMTGITLPFISYGGSSLLSSFILAGIVASFSAEAIQ
ncbi:MAG: FtsW/RodA/SpoVE family cell cycle protein [Sporomusaceae bacterium]|nr:FtsW/RodA/SpoVE family cell cycle protein [Sporomusaceae bacterium]